MKQEPEAVKPAEEQKDAAAEEVPAAKEDAPKGLPALGPRKKKTAAAEAAKQAEA